MNEKVLIVAHDGSNILDSITYLMEQEKLEYRVDNNLDFIDDIGVIIYIDNVNNSKELSYINIPTLIISSERVIIQNSNSIINYIITNLIDDNTIYTDVQKEYLFKKGIYSILNSKINEFISGSNNINGLIIDIKECVVAPSDWTFKFDSIAESYRWLSKKNKSGSKDFIKKEINFFNDLKVYNDSSKEINYLIDKLVDIKNGTKLIDIFLCSKDELEKLKRNFFFKALLNNISDTYNMYFVDINFFQQQESELLFALSDGLIIYDDCVYIDTYDDEYSLGYVDCNDDVIKRYDKSFNYILEKYGKKITSGGDYSEF